MFEFGDILTGLVAPMFFLGACLPAGGFGLSILVNSFKKLVGYVD